MNADELRKLAKTLNGIADGQPWQFEGCEFPWIDAWKHANPISVITDGLGIRLKPWALGRTVNGHTLPDGREWHRQDWTQDMLLPAPWRPLMLGEKRLDSDQYLNSHSKTWSEGHGALPMALGHNHSRTTRPIPVEPAPVLTPEQIKEGWVEWHGGECPVEPESRPKMMLRNGDIIEDVTADNLLARATDSIFAYKPDPLGHIRQAIADGKAVQWQAYDSEVWESYLKDRHSEPGVSPGMKWRIKPAGIPLGPEDVPPMSAIRDSSAAHPTWRAVVAIADDGIYCGPGEFESFSSLIDKEINRSIASGKWDPAAWLPCRKEAP